MKTTIIFALTLLFIGFAFIKLEQSTIAQSPQASIKVTFDKDCDSVVKHYSDSLKAVWKAKHNEVEMAKIKARKEFIWGKDSDGNIIDPMLYVYAEILALLALFVSVYVTVAKGVQTNPTSPAKFSFRYWWLNNSSKIFRDIAILILIFFLCRLSNEYFAQAFNFLYAVTLGAGLPQIIILWKNYNQRKIDAFQKTIGFETVTKPIDTTPTT